MKTISIDTSEERFKAAVTTVTTVLLDNVNKVKEFVKLANAHPGDIRLYSGAYVVDGKSIMGVFSLDLMQPVTVRITGDMSGELKVGLSKLVSPSMGV